MTGRAYAIASGQVGAWIAKLQESRPVLAPQLDPAGSPAILPVESAGAVDLTLDTRRSSVRGLWMPQTEVLFRYRVTHEGPQIRPAERPSRAQVVFGLHPCEAAAFRRIAKVLRGGVRPDPLGIESEELVLASLYCAAPRRGCFCAQVGSPIDMAEEGADLVLTPIEGAYVVHAVTDRGQAVVAEGGSLLAEASAAQVAAAETVQKGLIEKMAGREPIRPLESSAVEVWDDAIFQTQAARCIGCGICTYMCPSCHCFDILDDRAGQHGCRYRCWDSCQFGHFTMHASRHNPRESQADRMRQRVLHKLLYMPKEFGVTGCTGCGRCVELCPVGISIVEVLEDLQNAHPKAEVTQ